MTQKLSANPSGLVQYSGRVTALVERHNGVVTVRAEHGEWDMRPHFVYGYDSMLSELSDPEAAPELFRIREKIKSWRFYDNFRTDVDSAARW